MRRVERPDWVDPELYPFEDRELAVDGARMHYVDEGEGPPLLLLHGNPTWSFLYRELIRGLRDRFRCIALDYPGFGLSVPALGYGFTPAEHARVVEDVVIALDLHDAAMMVQDWGGPIGFAVAGRHPERFARFIIGNTWAWPVQRNPTVWAFARMMGGPVGRRLIQNRNIFVEAALPGGVKRVTLSPAVMAHYRGPFPTPASRFPVAVMPREILGSAPFLAGVEATLTRVADRPALIVWPDRDVAFGKRERRRWERVFPNHRTVELAGAGHYIQEDAPGEIVAAIRDWG
jgi:haloalkane dehalogenase